MDAESAAQALHPRILAWTRAQGWAGLRPVQAAAAAAIASGDDVLVSAGTSSGKTEAAFLPCLSSLLRSPAPSVGILAVYPLKSLINDQELRLSGLGREVGIPVTGWHGETPAEAKRALRREPEGVLLTTPESLEAMLLTRPGDVARMLGGLRFVVVDELHAFLAGDRGAHLASILARVEAALGRRPARIGLSATLGGTEAAASWLNPSAPGSVRVVEEGAGRRRMDVRVECFVEQVPSAAGVDEVLAEEMGYRTGLALLAERVHPRLSTGKNLVFAPSRRNVEALADILRRRAEAAGTPNPYLPHHGSLARSFREKVEAALRAPGVPATAIATTTLELGIDIGEVARVVQVGPPRSLAALRQRIGRSGRRAGTVPTLDVAVTVRPPRRDSTPLEGLYPDLVCALAAVHLLNAGFVEPPVAPASLSVLVHQVACVAKQGPVDAEVLAATLRQAAPFRAFGPERVRALLVRLSENACGVLERLGNGIVRLGPAGREMLSGPDAFSVFANPVEVALVYAGTRLGQVPVAAGNPLCAGDLLLFQGRRWRVQAVDAVERAVHVLPAPGGASLRYDGGEPAPLHDRLPETMRRIYASDVVPAILDAPGRAVLARARAAYRSLGLAATAFHVHGADTSLLPYVGTLRLRALALALQAEGLPAAALPYHVEVRRTAPADVAAGLDAVARRPAGRLDLVPGAVPEGKFDGRLDPAFRSAWWSEVNGIGELAQDTARLVLSGRCPRAAPRRKAHAAGIPGKEAGSAAGSA